MRWIAALLMIINVTVYLSAGGHQVVIDETKSISRPDVNKEGMLLLSEIGNLKQFGFIAGSVRPVPVLDKPSQDPIQNETNVPVDSNEDLKDDQQMDNVAIKNANTDLQD